MVYCVSISLAFIIVLLCIIFNKENTYLNSNVIRNNNYSIEDAKFEVIKIDRAFDSKGSRIIVYTLLIAYFAKDKNKNFVYKQYKLFSNVEKYKIGDILTLNLQEK